MTARLFAIPMTLREANAFVAMHHRHSKKVRGYRFAIGVEDASDFWGVAIFGRPISRTLGADRCTGEVLRNCVRDGAPLGCPSFLYAACWRAWRAMGGRKLVTYTLQSESGASLRGAGARVVAQLEPRDWSRERRDHLERLHQPVYDEPKLRWEWVA